MGTRVAFAVLYPTMVTAEGWSVVEVTSAYAAGVLLYACLAILAGIAVDRYGCRRLLLVGTAIITVGLLGMSRATEIWHLYAALMLVMGIGNAGVGFIVLIKLLSLRAGSRFPLAFGLAFTGQGLGSLVVSPAIQAAVEAVGWRTTTVTYACLMAAVLIPMAWLMAPGPEHHVEHAGTHASAWAGLRSDTLTWTFAIFFLANFGLGFTMLIPTHQVAYLLDIGFVAAVAASMAGAWGAMTSVGSVGGGWLVDRLGLSRAMATGYVLYVLGTLTLVASSPELFSLVVVYVVASGLGRGILGLALGSVQTQAFRGPRLGRMTGMLDIGFGAGAFLGPWATALIHDSAGSFAPGFLATLGSVTLVTVCTLAGARRRSPV
jgi:nitrate/nitrite transporter NarK